MAHPTTPEPTTATPEKKKRKQTEIEKKTELRANEQLDQTLERFQAEGDDELEILIRAGADLRQMDLAKRTVGAADLKAKRSHFEAAADLAALEAVDISSETITDLQQKRDQLLDPAAIDPALTIPPSTTPLRTVVETQINNFIGEVDAYQQTSRESRRGDIESRLKQKIKDFFSLTPLDATRIVARATELEAAEATRLSCVKIEGLSASAIADLRTRRAEFTSKTAGAVPPFDIVQYDAAVTALESMIASPLTDAATAATIKTQAETLLSMNIPDILNTPDGGIEPLAVEDTVLDSIDAKALDINNDIDAGFPNKVTVVASANKFATDIRAQRNILLSPADKAKITREINTFLNLEIPDHAKKQAEAEKVHRANPTWDEVKVWETACGRLETKLQNKLATLPDISTAYNNSAADRRTAVQTAKDTLAASIDTNVASLTSITPTIDRAVFRNTAATEAATDFTRNINAITETKSLTTERRNLSNDTATTQVLSRTHETPYTARQGLEREPAVRDGLTHLFDKIKNGTAIVCDTDPITGASISGTTDPDIIALETGMGLTVAEIMRQIVVPIRARQEAMVTQLARQEAQPKDWKKSLAVNLNISAGAMIAAAAIGTPWLLVGGGVVAGAYRLWSSRKQNQKALQNETQIRRTLRTNPEDNRVSRINADLRDGIFALAASAKKEQFRNSILLDTAGNPVAETVLQQRMRDIRIEAMVRERRDNPPGTAQEIITEKVNRVMTLLQMDINSTRLEQRAQAERAGGFGGTIDRIVERLEGANNILTGGKTTGEKAGMTATTIALGLASRVWRVMQWGDTNIAGGLLLGYGGQALGNLGSDAIVNNTEYFRSTKNITLAELTPNNIWADPTLVTRARAQVVDPRWLRKPGNRTEANLIKERIAKIDELLIKKGDITLTNVGAITDKAEDRLRERQSKQTQARMMNLGLRVAGATAGAYLGTFGFSGLINTIGHAGSYVDQHVLGGTVGGAYDHVHDSLVDVPTQGIQSEQIAPAGWTEVTAGPQVMGELNNIANTENLSGDNLKLYLHQLIEQHPSSFATGQELHDVQNDPEALEKLLNGKVDAIAGEIERVHAGGGQFDYLHDHNHVPLVSSYSDEIRTTAEMRGSHDSIWRSTMQVYEKNAAALGYDSAKDGSVHHWAEAETNRVVNEVNSQTPGGIKDLVHNGDMVHITKGPDGLTHLGVTNNSGLKMGHLPPQHVEASAPKVIETKLPERQVVVTEHTLSPEQQHALDDIRHSHDDSSFPLKNMQGRANVRQNWETLFGKDVPFDRHEANRIVDELAGGASIDDVAHDHHIPLLGTEQTVSSAAHSSDVPPIRDPWTGADHVSAEDHTHVDSHSVQHSPAHETAADSHVTAHHEVLDTRTSSTEISASALKHVDKVEYHSVVSGGSAENPTFAQTDNATEVNLKDYTSSQKELILKTLRMLDVGKSLSVTGEFGNPVLMRGTPSPEMFIDWVNTGSWGEVKAAIETATIAGQHVDLANSIVSQLAPNNLDPAKWYHFISTDLLESSALVQR